MSPWSLSRRLLGVSHGVVERPNYNLSYATWQWLILLSNAITGVYALVSLLSVLVEVLDMK